jgi:D-alanine-D-alanine ligase
MDGSRRVGVLVGGLSAERELSVRAGEAVSAALRDAGHDATTLFVDRDVDLAVRQARIEVAFLAVRGRYGGDGCLQGLLELVGVPYTGSGVLASALAMNRAKTKEVLRLHNLPTASGYVLRSDAQQSSAQAHGSFGFPAVVRPVGLASPLGGVVARDELELEAALEDAFRLDGEALVERLIDGRRVQVAVLDGLPIGAVEIPAPARPGRPASVTPVTSRFSAARYRSLLRLAGAAYEALGCEGAACVELVVSDRLNEVVLDVDTNPLLLPGATLPRIAERAGLSHSDLVHELLAGARLRAHGHRTNRRDLQLTFEGPDRRATAASAVAH